MEEAAAPDPVHDPFSPTEVTAETDPDLNVPANRVKPRLAFGHTLSSSLALYAINLPQFLLIGMIIYAPLFLLMIGYGENLNPYVQSLVSFTLGQLLSASIIYAVFRRMQKERAGTGKCLALGLGRLVHLVLLVMLISFTLCLVAVLPVTVGVALTALVPRSGLVSLITLAAMIPVAMVYCALYVAPPILVVERKGVLESFRRSQVLTKGNRLIIFLFLLVTAVANFLAAFLAHWISWIWPGVLAGPGWIHAPLVGIVKSLFVGVLGAVFTSMVYYQLKVQVDGMDEAELAAIFD
jgi:hypothetical protein